MKKAMLFIAAILTIAACASREDKANKLIDEYMYKHLHDYKSYEPVETKVDTLYNSPLFDEQCIQAALQRNQYEDLADEYESDARHDHSSMDIWSGGWSSTARSEYKKALKGYLENSAKQFEAMGKSAEAWKEAFLRIQELSGKEHVGWMVDHTYRCNNRGGNSMISSTLFLMDKDMKTILKSYDEDDEDIAEAVSTINNIMNDSSCNAAMLDTLINSYKDLAEKSRQKIEEYGL